MNPVTLYVFSPTDVGLATALELSVLSTVSPSVVVHMYVPFPPAPDAVSFAESPIQISFERGSESIKILGRAFTVTVAVLGSLEQPSRLPVIVYVRLSVSPSVVYVVLPLTNVVLPVAQVMVYVSAVPSVMLISAFVPLQVSILVGTENDGIGLVSTVKLVSP